MNRVTVSLVPFGPYVLDFRCGADDFLSIVNIVKERLTRMGYDASVPLYVNVR